MSIEIIYSTVKNKYLRADQLRDGMAVILCGDGFDFDETIYIVNKVSSKGLIGFSIDGENILHDDALVRDFYKFKEVNLKIEVSGI